MQMSRQNQSAILQGKIQPAQEEECAEDRLVEAGLTHLRR